MPVDDVAFPRRQQASKRIRSNFSGFRSAAKEDKLVQSVATDVLNEGACVASHPLGI